MKVSSSFEYYSILTYIFFLNFILLRFVFHFHITYHLYAVRIHMFRFLLLLLSAVCQSFIPQILLSAFSFINNFISLQHTCMLWNIQHLFHLQFLHLLLSFLPSKFFFSVSLLLSLRSCFKLEPVILTF